MIQHLHCRPWTQLHSETECLWWDIDVDRKESTSGAEWARGWPESGGERTGAQACGEGETDFVPSVSVAGFVLKTIKLNFLELLLSQVGI